MLIGGFYMLEYYEYGDKDFSDYYYREKIGCLKLVLLCLRYGFIDTWRRGVEVIVDTIDYISRNNLGTILFSALSFLAISTSMLFMLGILFSLCLYIAILNVLVTVSISSTAIFLILCTCNASVKYLKEKRLVARISLYACKLPHKTWFGSVNKIHFHRLSNPVPSKILTNPSKVIPIDREIKASGIDLDYIPRSLLFEQHSYWDK